MPPVIPGKAGRQAQALANPANQARALAQQQQGGSSGTIPGTSSSPQQVAHTTGVIPVYPPDGRSPNGDQVAGVGIQVLNNAGDPVVVMGNLSATLPPLTMPMRAADAKAGVIRESVSALPSSFQDGGFAFIDADGNFVAGYSQETGLFGFGGGGGGGGGSSSGLLTAWMDWRTSASMYVNVFGGTAGLTIPGYGISVPAVQPPSSGLYVCNASVTQVGHSPATGAIGFLVSLRGMAPPDPASNPINAVVTAYTLDGVNSIDMSSNTCYGPDANGSYLMAAWTVNASTGSVFSAVGDGMTPPALAVSTPCLMACNFLLQALGS